MAKQKKPQPTEAELLILHVLWTDGPSTVRQVHDAICKRRATGYTTTLKLMQIMAEKGLVERDQSQRSHVYHARISQDRAQRQLVRNLLDQAFEGSAKKLVMQALSTKKTSVQELAEIRALLDSLEGDKS